MKSRISLVLIAAGILFGLWVVSDFPVLARNGNYPRVNNNPENSPDFVPRREGPFQDYIDREYSGNAAFMSQNGENAVLVIWDNESRDWYSITLPGDANDLVESNGNFCAYAQAGRKIQIAAWNKVTKEFSPVVEYADSIVLFGVDSNFAFYTSNERAGVWVPQTGGWRDIPIPGKMVRVAGSDYPYTEVRTLNRTVPDDSDFK